MKKQKCENRGGQRRMTTSTCPNLLLSLRAFLSPCSSHGWWCPVRERERERTSDSQSVMTGLPPFLFLSGSFFAPSSSSSRTLSLFSASFPIIHPWTSADSKMCPGATQSPMSCLCFPSLSFFFLVYYTLTDISCGSKKVRDVVE